MISENKNDLYISVSKAIANSKKTLQLIANESGISRTHIIDIRNINQKKKASLDIILKLADYLDVKYNFKN